MPALWCGPQKSELLVAGRASTPALSSMKHERTALQLKVRCKCVSWKQPLFIDQEGVSQLQNRGQLDRSLFFLASSATFGFPHPNFFPPARSAGPLPHEARSCGQRSHSASASNLYSPGSGPGTHDRPPSGSPRREASVSALRRDSEQPDHRSSQAARAAGRSTAGVDFARCRASRRKKSAAFVPNRPPNSTPTATSRKSRSFRHHDVYNSQVRNNHGSRSENETIVRRITLSFIKNRSTKTTSNKENNKSS